MKTFWNKAIAIAFSIVYAVLSFGILLLSKENPSLSYGAIGFFVISIFLLWTVYVFLEKKQVIHKTFWLGGVAICITSMIFPTYLITEKISSAQTVTLEDNFRNTQVIDFHDEVLFTDKNNPIGVRLRYTVIVPQSGRYFPEPSVENGKNNRIGHFRITEIKIDPLPKQLEQPGTSLTGKYTAGVSYNVIADLNPNFLLPDSKTGNLCAYIKDVDEENLIKNAKSEQWEVDIQGTSFSRYYGQGVHYLENKYNIKDFYDSIPKENIPKCEF